ncbi:winged helix-turn-helix domain-containing protein [Enterobacter sp. 22466]|uniref:winged helix-turn-helix domain-containing protein n=1 Tax=Enterobacter sp. 22466 TaxID=3453924 RepID=UPI003F8779C0
MCDKQNDIIFGSFVFNPKSRVLSIGEDKQQLRKKEAAVLKLLCDKYPEPALHQDFLSEVWEGSYVNPHSIAQIVRSLRKIMGDEGRAMIITIPKLGYQLGTAPSCSGLGGSQVEDVVSAEEHTVDVDDEIHIYPLSVTLPVAPPVRPTGFSHAWLWLCRLGIIGLIGGATFGAYLFTSSRVIVYQHIDPSSLPIFAPGVLPDGQDDASVIYQGKVDNLRFSCRESQKGETVCSAN